ncbi:MAG: HAD family hydrolase [Candidatus Dormibacteria bacterium]
MSAGDGGPVLPGPAGHLIWDWNGTLLDDARAVMAATSAAFDEAGVAVTVSEEVYRRSFTRPIPLFYERLAGRPIAADEWVRLDHAFHDRYRVLAEACRLTAGAVEALDRVRGRGWTQSLCSMLPEELLLAAVEGHGLCDYFVRIDGLRGAVRGGAKLEHLVTHRERLGAVPARTVMIGDTVDDAVAAGGAGLECVLLDGGRGLHSSEALASAGVPVVASLAEAVDLLLPPAPGAGPPGDGEAV